MATTKPRVINFFAGPGAGKSTMAARLFSELKFRGHTPELCQEWVKEGAYEGVQVDDRFVSRIEFLTKNQLYILSKQLFRMNKMKDHVDWIVTDSPLLLTLVYARPDELNSGLRNLVIDYFHEFDNLNFYVSRTKPYIPIGRNQDEEQAKTKDEEVKVMLDKLKVPYHEIQSDRVMADRVIPEYYMPQNGWLVNPLKGEQVAVLPKSG